GFVFPINTIAALLASLPSTTSWASIRCHWRLIPFFVGNSVLIDTRLQLFAVAKYLVYGVWGFVVKLGYKFNRVVSYHRGIAANWKNNLRVVLVSTRNPLNIGAAARAMANFGFARLCVVSPYDV